MSKLIGSIIEKASKLQKTIVLAEGNDHRVVTAAEIIVRKGIASIILLGDENEIKQNITTSYPNLTIINPSKSEKLGEFASDLYEARKAKGLTKEKAEELVKSPLFFGAMLTKKGYADGMVAGAINSTGNVLRAGLQTVKTAKGINTVSSVFLMCFENTMYKENEVMVFGDCAVNPNPNASQLADIALASADSAKNLAGIEPRIAMLSFSTKGSAKHENVDKVVEAVGIVQKTAPYLAIDGELQVDAALDCNVGMMKAPESAIAGKANVLIFPDLQSGNIGYKLVQRMAKAEAIGPICQGFSKPINDLSRGCSIEDIVAVVAITAVQAKNLN